MYIHHALPKDLLPRHHPPQYQIKKKFSPLHRERKHKVKQQQKIDHSLSQKSNINNVAASNKVVINLFAKDKDSSPMVAQTSHSILLQKKRQADADSHDLKSQSPYNKTQKSGETEHHKIVCRMQNKAVQPASSPFSYLNLSLIEQRFWLSYEGESKNNGVRHGFGTQYYVNGEKYMGFFQQNRAQGQGTYYSLTKTIMGIWQQDQLKEVILEL